MGVELYLEFRREILRGLVNKGKWGGAHTSIKNIANKIARDKRGSKEAKAAVSDLIKEGKLIIKPTVEDSHVSLNPKFIKEINAELRGNLSL